jgi:Mycobacterium membrane protein
MMSLPRRSLLLLIGSLFLLPACQDDKYGRSSLRAPLGQPTTVPPPVVIVPTHVSYRVTGTIPGVEITYANTAQGTTLVTTDLPWFASFDTTNSTTFVYLAAAAPPDNVTDGSITVQIFVDGALFRESRASGFTASVAVSGEVTR